MKKNNRIVVLFLMFTLLIGCQATHQTRTLITDKSSINHPFIVTYVTGKFSEYGYSVNQDEQIKIYKDNEEQWTFTQTNSRQHRKHHHRNVGWSIRDSGNNFCASGE
ncbi:hypothetical protein MX850_10700 [Erysipelothrix sp. Poltava]|nr:hypothetical protein MX850_10700 [Erysipelothrix sp. Poltava]